MTQLPGRETRNPYLRAVFVERLLCYMVYLTGRTVEFVHASLVTETYYWIIEGEKAISGSSLAEGGLG